MMRDYIGEMTKIVRLNIGGEARTLIFGSYFNRDGLIADNVSKTYQVDVDMVRDASNPIIDGRHIGGQVLLVPHTDEAKTNMRIVLDKTADFFTSETHTRTARVIVEEDESEEEVDDDDDEGGSSEQEEMELGEAGEEDDDDMDEEEGNLMFDIDEDEIGVDEFGNPLV